MKKPHAGRLGAGMRLFGCGRQVGHCQPSPGQWRRPPSRGCACPV